jgi:hypothetical protein
MVLRRPIAKILKKECVLFVFGQISSMSDIFKAPGTKHIPPHGDCQLKGCKSTADTWLWVSGDLMRLCFDCVRLVSIDMRAKERNKSK